MEKIVYVENDKGLWICEAGACKGEILTLAQLYGKYPFPKTHEYYAPKPGVLEVYLRGTYKEKPTVGKAGKTVKAEPTAPGTKEKPETPPGRYYDLLGPAQGTLF